LLGLNSSPKSGILGGVGHGIVSGHGIGIRYPTGRTSSDWFPDVAASVFSWLFDPSASEFLATGVTPGRGKVGSEAK
jgi:hypothetical protein